MIITIFNREQNVVWNVQFQSHEESDEKKEKEHEEDEAAEEGTQSPQTSLWQALD